jgi:hypothetical protein
MKEFILISEFAIVVMSTIFAFAFLIDWGAKQVIKRIKN